MIHLGLEGPVLIIAGKTVIGLLAQSWHRSLEEAGLKNAVRLTSLPKDWTGLRGSLVSGVSMPMSRTVSGWAFSAECDLFLDDAGHLRNRYT